MAGLFAQRAELDVNPQVLPLFGQVFSLFGRWTCQFRCGGSRTYGQLEGIFSGFLGFPRFEWLRWDTKTLL